MLLFIIFGWPRRTKEYGETYPMHCDRCDNDQYFSLMKARRWFTIYFIPLLPLWFSTKALLCPICGAGFELSRPEYKAAKTLNRSTKAYLADELTEDEYLDEIDAFEATIEVSGGEVQDDSPVSGAIDE